MTDRSRASHRFCRCQPPTLCGWGARRKFHVWIASRRFERGFHWAGGGFHTHSWALGGAAQLSVVHPSRQRPLHCRDNPALRAAALLAALWSHLHTLYISARKAEVNESLSRDCLLFRSGQQVHKGKSMHWILEREVMQAHGIILSAPCGERTAHNANLTSVPVSKCWQGGCRAKFII